MGYFLDRMSKYRNDFIGTKIATETTRIHALAVYPTLHAYTTTIAT